MKRAVIHRNYIIPNYLPLTGGEGYPGDKIFVRPLPEEGKYLLVAGYGEYIRSLQEGRNILQVTELDAREIDRIFNEEGFEEYFREKGNE